ncbi:MAG: DUF1064 domain-containing protein [Defluviitaleaceae bacterium]|nr:DUF1064 domain-containing protein [Defluviitaleaceae bacterium]MCL2261648.1 DUF1064 domain-containing protein [Defluviitaleaceae bacterium]
MTTTKIYPKGKSRSKYGNQKTTLDGHTFDSKAEALRYHELKLLEKAGEILQLELQPKFTLVPKTKKRRAVTYTADFRYLELYTGNGKDIETNRLAWINGLVGEGAMPFMVIVEDVKSPATAKDKAYIVKRNLFEFQNPKIDFREVLSC